MISKTKIVGILNITPDSFSGDTGYFSADEIADKAFEMSEQGADIIDIGAESTRPNATEISDYEEILRLIPVLKKLKERNFKTPISIDTRKFEVAKKAMETIDVAYLNDVSGFSDKRMIDLLKQYNCKAIFMHSLTVPVDKNINIPESENIISFLENWAFDKIKVFEKHGVSKDNLIFDAGIGFGKTAKQSLEIIKNISAFKNLEIEVLVGHSEKSFLSLFTNEPAGKRNIETQLISSFLIQNNIDYIRVHNVSDAVKNRKVSNTLKQ